MTASRRRRVSRLLRAGPSVVVRTAAREARWRTATRALELRLMRARRRREPIVVGPFVGEIGFELLYWIPFLRRALRGLDPSRVVAFTRGGAAAWYDGIARGELEIFDLMEPAEYLARLRTQRSRSGEAKLFEVGELERELIRRARVDERALIHPRLMYGRLRWAWFGVAPLETLDAELEHRPLDPPPLADHLELPDDFVALKPYFSRVFPDEPRNRAFLHELAARLDPVVLLAGERTLDDHLEWFEAPVAARLEPAAEPRRNLALQTAVIARARALVATYGGFSYLGPLLGVPTVSFLANDDHNTIHLDAARRYLPGQLDVVPADADAVALRLAPERQPA